jgi:hypothetical protein
MYLNCIRIITINQLLLRHSELKFTKTFSVTQSSDLLFLDITTFILDLFNKHCPVNEVHFVQYPNRKYLSSSTKQMIRQRDQLYLVNLQNGNREPTIELKSLNKQIQRCIREDTRSELNIKINKMNLWSGLRKLIFSTIYSSIH